MKHILQLIVLGGQGGSQGGGLLQRVDAPLVLFVLGGGDELRLLKLDLIQFCGLNTMINRIRCAQTGQN